jgi:hypothetical protein
MRSKWVYGRKKESESRKRVTKFGGPKKSKSRKCEKSRKFDPRVGVGQEIQGVDPPSMVSHQDPKSGPKWGKESKMKEKNPKKRKRIQMSQRQTQRSEKVQNQLPAIFEIWPELAQSPSKTMEKLGLQKAKIWGSNHLEWWATHKIRGKRPKQPTWDLGQTKMSAMDQGINLEPIPTAKWGCRTGLGSSEWKTQPNLS